jgi:hypothetical protein
MAIERDPDCNQSPDVVSGKLKCSPQEWSHVNEPSPDTCNVGDKIKEHEMRHVARLGR